MLERLTIAIALCLSACAQAPPAEPVAALPPTVVVSTPAPPPVVERVVVREIQKPVIVEKTIIREIAKPVVVEKRVVVRMAPAHSRCKGLSQPKCTAVAGCRWVAHTKPVDKNGRPLTDYCRVSR